MEVVYTNKSEFQLPEIAIHTSYNHKNTKTPFRTLKCIFPDNICLVTLSSLLVFYPQKF